MKILRLPDVLSRVGIKRSMVYQLVKEGSFPAPISLGLRAVGWDEKDVDKWISKKIKESRKG